METKKAKVSLINWTKNPIETMCWSRRVMHSNVPDELDLTNNESEWLGMSYEQYFDEVLMKDGMPTFQEYVLLTFKLENVSRALQQQLTRHRIGFSYAIQSMRCVDLPNFATDGLYYNPYKNNTLENEQYHLKMVNIQEEYKKALEEGVPTQDARGLLPLNIYSTITFSCTLRALIGMLNKRLCLKTQGEFKHVAQLISAQLANKLDPRVLSWIGAPCVVNKYCIMKGENEQQLKERKLSGKQSTDHVCPLYIKIWREKHDKI